MAKYEVSWKKSAYKELSKLPSKEISNIVDIIENLTNAPRPTGVRKLVGSENTYRLRVRNYRVIYTVNDDVLTIHIVRIRHRKDAY